MDSWGREPRSPEMRDERVLGTDDVGVAQVGMAAFQEVAPPRRLQNPVFVDKAPLGPPGASQVAQVIVPQHSLQFVFHRCARQALLHIPNRCHDYRCSTRLDNLQALGIIHSTSCEEVWYAHCKVHRQRAPVPQ